MLNWKNKNQKTKTTTIGNLLIFALPNHLRNYRLDVNLPFTFAAIFHFKITHLQF